MQLDLKNLPAIIVNRVLRRQPLAISHIRRRLTTQKIPFSPVPYMLRDPLDDDTLTSFPHPPSVPFEETLPAAHFMSNGITQEDNKSIGSREYYPWIKKSPDSLDRYRASTLPISSTRSSHSSVYCESYGGDCNSQVLQDECSRTSSMNSHGRPRLFTNSLPDRCTVETNVEDRASYNQRQSTNLSCDIDEELTVGSITISASDNQ